MKTIRKSTDVTIMREFFSQFIANSEQGHTLALEYRNNPIMEKKRAQSREKSVTVPPFHSLE